MKFAIGLMSAALMAAPVVYPPEIQLFGAGAAQTVVVEGDGCSLRVADGGIAEVSSGRVVAKAKGATWLTAKCDSGLTTVPVVVRAAGALSRKSFVNDVAPIFTMAGCSGANCHGSIRGQHGFKLSLFGYEPAIDYEAIGRRIDKAAPEKSLVLAKATAQTAHGGGFRFAADSLEYRTILEWIREGAPYDTKDTPRMTDLRVYPRERILVGKDAAQQLVAVAYYSDGAVRDVTRLVQYSSNNPDVVQVNAKGEAKALQTGETAVMVRTMGRAVAARILVAESRPDAAYTRVSRNNFIDEHVFAKLQKLNIRPSELSSDGEFLRRVYLDAIGKLPTEEEARAFLQSNIPDKRAKIVDWLLEQPEFADVWALKFAELTRAGTREAGSKGGRIVYEWLRQSFAANKPYDKLVTELLLSQGAHLFGKGPSSFYNISFDSNAADHATNIGQIFLGVRIECAKCHNHPWEKWTQDDFYGFAAFFARVAVKEVYENDENATVYNEEGAVIHPKTKKPVTPKYLDGVMEADEPDKDIRESLARWMSRADNPFFARAFVNRVWKHYLGRGLVEEVDDFRVTNPPTNPALLDALAADFVKNKFDVRRLVRTILLSRTYQLSARPNETNRGDAINYSRFGLRRLMAETFTDSIAQVTAVPDKFAGYPIGTRAMQVYSGANYMLSTFGRLNRDIICERETQPDIAQTMHLISGDTIQKKLTAEGNIISRWMTGDVVDSLFLRTLTRFPTASEKEALDKALAGGDRKAVLQDALWAILNSKEFLYNH
ncbi:MAG: DUF1549 domain-containing protein [Bryobacteraceae bacterium]